jgi:hypothetical protein
MIELENYLNTFQQVANQLDKKILKKLQIEVAVGEVLDSVFLKMYKRSWSTPNEDPLSAKSKIFFSIWANDSTINEQKICYNIHAFKIRHLNGYAIESRKFADLFRVSFKEFAHQWPNASVKFGPLTLMEGWVKVDPDNYQQEVLKLANSFLGIAYLVDDTLAEFKR